MKKVYLGNTLLKDDAEKRMLDSTINSLQKDVSSLTKTTIWTGSIVEDNGRMRYNAGGDNPITDYKAVNSGDIFQFSHSNPITNYFTVLNGTTLNYNINVDYRGILLLNIYNVQYELRMNGYLYPVDRIAWYFTANVDGTYKKLIPIENQPFSLSFDFNKLKISDIIYVSNNQSYVVLSKNEGYYSETESNLQGATLALCGNESRLFKMCLDGRLIPLDEISYDGFIKNRYKIVEFKTGNSAQIITEQQFIDKLQAEGALKNNTVSSLICTWSYSTNDTVNTPIGNIQLAGSTIIVNCQYYTATTKNGSFNVTIITANSGENNINRVIVLRHQNLTNIWRMLANTTDLPLSGCTSNFSNWSAIPCTTKLYIGMFNTDITIGVSGSIPIGEDIILHMYNGASVNRTINLTNFTIRNVDTITVPAYKRAEISILALADNATSYAVRGINYED